MLEVQDIHTYYGDSYILQGVSLQIGDQWVLGMLGRNGVGKTTLIRSIIGFTPARRGKIVFKGLDITGVLPHRIAKMGIGLVPQGRRVFKSLTVEENLKVTAMDRGHGWSMESIHSLFPVLKARARQKAGKLSGGEQQMLATARALRSEPDLLLMDEPSEGLAPLLVKKLGDVVQELKTKGLSLFIIEQNFAFAVRFSDHVSVMSKGRIVHESSPEDLEKNEAVKDQYLGL